MTGTVFLVGTRWFGVLGPCKLMIEEFVARGMSVYVIGAEDDKHLQFPVQGVKLVKMRFKRSYFSLHTDFLDLLKLVWLTIREKPDYIHSFNPKPSVFAAVASKFCNGELFVGVTGLGNTYIKNTPLHRAFRKVISKACRSADWVFFQNKDDLEYFSIHILGGAEKCRFFKSPGVDLPRFTFHEIPSEVSGKLKVLFVGRMLWQKGVDDFLDVWREIKRLGHENDYEFTAVGPRDREHPDRLLPEDLNALLESGVSWIEWTDRIEAIYPAHDVLLFMSHREGAPRAILEAAACGRPTIGANTPGVKELVIDTQTGFLVELHDITKICSHLHDYRLNRKLLSQHGKQARKLIAEPLSLRNASRAQLQMYFDDI